MALSELAVRQAKTTGKDYTLGDSDGLALSVSAQGGKIWHFRYYWNNKQKRISLGTYPEVSLKDARVRRDTAREQVAQGINPSEHRRQKRREAGIAEHYTFQTVFEQWIEHRRHHLKEGRQSTLSQILRIFNRDVLPSLGKRSIYVIQRSDLLDLLNKIEERNALTTAEKVRTWFNQLFRFALIKVPRLQTNPATDLDVMALPKPPIIHNPFLRMEELPELLKALRDYRGCLQNQLGLRLLLLTGVRTGELRLATPEQFDLEQGLWIIPPESVKQLQLEMRKHNKSAQDILPYIVPLSAQAVEAVRYLLNDMQPGQQFLLGHRNRPEQRISENTLNYALHRMGYANRLTGHGIRATLSTALYEIGYPKPWIEAQLSHSDPNKVSAAYNHAEYVEQRRSMMQDWADRLDLWEQGYVEAASTPLTIRFESIHALPDKKTEELSAPSRPVLSLVPPVSTQPNQCLQVSYRLPVVPPPPPPKEAPEPVISDIQKQRAAMLEAYEASHSLPVPEFARLAGKSRDQINRDIKANRLLAISLGNRGQRIPDWQLDPVKSQLVRRIMEVLGPMDRWALYFALTEPTQALAGQTPIDAMKIDQLDAISQRVIDRLSTDSKAHLALVRAG